MSTSRSTPFGCTHLPPRPQMSKLSKPFTAPISAFKRLTRKVPFAQSKAPQLKAPQPKAPQPNMWRVAAQALKELEWRLITFFALLDGLAVKGRACLQELAQKAAVAVKGCFAYIKEQVLAILSLAQTSTVAIGDHVKRANPWKVVFSCVVVLSFVLNTAQVLNNNSVWSSLEDANNKIYVLQTTVNKNRETSDQNFFDVQATADKDRESSAQKFFDVQATADKDRETSNKKFYKMQATADEDRKAFQANFEKLVQGDDLMTVLLKAGVHMTVPIAAPLVVNFAADLYDYMVPVAKCTYDSKYC